MLLFHSRTEAEVDRIQGENVIYNRHRQKTVVEERRFSYSIHFVIHEMIIFTWNLELGPADIKWLHLLYFPGQRVLYTHDPIYSTPMLWLATNHFNGILQSWGRTHKNHASIPLLVVDIHALSKPRTLSYG